jgi:hypothetical protein
LIEMLTDFTDLTPTLSLLEAIYLLVVGTGWFVVLRELLSTRRDLALLRSRKINGARSLSAASRLWGHLAILAAYTFMLGFGVQAATAPPPTNPNRSTVVAVAICVYMGLSLISTGAVLWSGRIYERLLDLLESRAKKTAERREAETAEHDAVS